MMMSRMGDEFPQCLRVHVDWEYTLVDKVTQEIKNRKKFRVLVPTVSSKIHKGSNPEFRFRALQGSSIWLQAFQSLIGTYGKIMNESKKYFIIKTYHEIKARSDYCYT